MVKGRSSFFVAVVSVVPSGLKMSPVPSSLMVAVPVTAVPPVGVAVSVKVSPVSGVPSFTIVVRTSSAVAPPVNVALNAPE